MCEKYIRTSGERELPGERCLRGPGAQFSQVQETRLQIDPHQKGSREILNSCPHIESSGNEGSTGSLSTPPGRGQLRNCRLPPHHRFSWADGQRRHTEVTLDLLLAFLNKKPPAFSPHHCCAPALPWEPDFREKAPKRNRVLQGTVMPRLHQAVPSALLTSAPSG